MQRRLRPATVLLLLAALGGCAQASLTPPPSARLPRDAFEGAGDPARGAIFLTAYSLASPARLAGRPAQAAAVLAQYEFMTVELIHGPRWVGMPPLIAHQLLAGREEARRALGIAPDAPPQQVIDGLFAAANAFEEGRDPAAALPQAAFPDPAVTAQRLVELPPLPIAARAASAAQQGLWRMDRGRQWQFVNGPGRLGS